MSGTPLFMMKGMVVVPQQLKFHKWSDALEDLGDKLNVSVRIGVVK